MAEGGEKPRIIINAKGTEKEVPHIETSGPKPKPEEREEKEEPKEGAGQFAKGAAAGAIAGEILETAVNQGAKAVRKALYGEGEKRGPGREKKPAGNEENYWDQQEAETQFTKRFHELRRKLAK